MSLDIFHEQFFTGFDERQSRSFVVSSGRSAHSMDVGFDVGREIKVDDIGDKLEVDSSYNTRFFVLIPFALSNEIIQF